jgi:hypothetical protein
MTIPDGKKENRVLYNMNGQRVTSPVKGFYVVNGKKYIVR